MFLEADCRRISQRVVSCSLLVPRAYLNRELRHLTSMKSQTSAKPHSPGSRMVFVAPNLNIKQSVIWNVNAKCVWKQSSTALCKYAANSKRIPRIAFARVWKRCECDKPQPRNYNRWRADISFRRKHREIPNFHMFTGILTWKKWKNSNANLNSKSRR